MSNTSRTPKKAMALRAALSIRSQLPRWPSVYSCCPLAPPHAESAIVTIGQLEASGFDVKVDRVGSAPLDQCQVTSVRNPRSEPKSCGSTDAVTATASSRSSSAGPSPSRWTARTADARNGSPTQRDPKDM
jgi:hypothetical protein